MTQRTMNHIQLMTANMRFSSNSRYGNGRIRWSIRTTRMAGQSVESDEHHGLTAMHGRHGHASKRRRLDTRPARQLDGVQAGS